MVGKSIYGDFFMWIGFVVLVIELFFGEDFADAVSFVSFRGVIVGRVLAFFA